MSDFRERIPDDEREVPMDDEQELDRRRRPSIRSRRSSRRWTSSASKDANPPSRPASSTPRTLMPRGDDSADRRGPRRAMPMTTAASGGVDDGGDAPTVTTPRSSASRCRSPARPASASCVTLPYPRFTVLLDPARRLAAIDRRQHRRRDAARSAARPAMAARPPGPGARAGRARRSTPTTTSTADTSSAAATRAGATPPRRGRRREATFLYTNAAPQASGFNQSNELWLGLEDHVLQYADATASGSACSPRRCSPPTIRRIAASGSLRRFFKVGRVGRDRPAAARARGRRIRTRPVRADRRASRAPRARRSARSARSRCRSPRSRHWRESTSVRWSPPMCSGRRPAQGPSTWRAAPCAGGCRTRAEVYSPARPPRR